MGNKKLLLLTLVHPDFLPPVYAVAQVLRDLSYDIHVLTFDSFTPANLDIGNNIIIESLGKHHSIGTIERLKLRRKFTLRARQLAAQKPEAIISFCPFSFLSGLKIKNGLPLLYIALEVADFILPVFLNSPLSNLKNLQALQNVHKAQLVATPSIQRSAWLAGRCHLDFMPYTILNTAYLKGNEISPVSNINFNELIPGTFKNKKIVLYTGAVNAHLCIMELVQAFDMVNDNDSVLIITGMKDNTYCDAVRAYIEGSSIKNKTLLFPYITRAQMLYIQAAAHIGVCLAKEYENNVESKMMAPNKVGEYLSKGLYLLSIRNEYMLPFEMKGIAALSASHMPEDISIALKKALKNLDDSNYKYTIQSFVNEYFCMQQQLKPVIKYLSAISTK